MDEDFEAVLLEVVLEALLDFVDELLAPELLLELAALDLLLEVAALEEVLLGLLLPQPAVTNRAAPSRPATNTVRRRRAGAKRPADIGLPLSCGTRSHGSWTLGPGGDFHGLILAFGRATASGEQSHPSPSPRIGPSCGDRGPLHTFAVLVWVLGVARRSGRARKR